MTLRDWLLLLGIALLIAAEAAVTGTAPRSAHGLASTARGLTEAPHVGGSLDPRKGNQGAVSSEAEFAEALPPSGASLIRGTATWYCGNGSPCTRGYGPSDLVAAIDPTTGIAKGTRVTVRHEGREVVVRVVDTCACAGARVIDLTRLAFSRLADPSRGVIAVTLGVGPVPTLPATDTGGASSPR